MDFLLPLTSFFFVASITPGPNNLMLSASGIAFGWRRTLPHMFGVSVGFALLLAVCGSGVGAFVARVPAAGFSLKAVGTAYLLYLAWTMRHALAPREHVAGARPLSFLEAAAFQFVNPKGWVMALTVMSVFLPDVEPRWLGVCAVITVCVLIGLPCISTWALLGATLKRRLADERLRMAGSTAIVVLMTYAALAIWM